MGRTVAVVGGGYGGSLVARELDDVADVVLIDPRDAFVNAAGSLRALTRPDWAPRIFFPFDTLLTRGRFVRDAAVSVDARGVALASGGRVEADYVVLATGSGYTFPGKPRPGVTDTAEALADLRASHEQLAGAGRVLIVGAGPVGLELAGEINDAWPDKHVVVVDRNEQLLPFLLPEVRDDLRTQLDKAGVELRLGAGLASAPPVGPGRAGEFRVATEGGEEITADIWFRTYGLSLNTGWLPGGELTSRGTVPVTERLTVRGYDRMYALGDIVDLPDPKMASYAQQQAQTVVANIGAQLAGERPEAVHPVSPHRRMLIPLGTRGGAGQMPAPGGVAPVSVETVRERKGADLFTAQFARRFRS
ncbi:NAD(P)/FAD-dependent oxidoreductase [Actinoplanes sp. RD1]|uniref:NAD(P)/FAD-dependent oxidoreductase n=1 Tax=Actinoplanes sp. RD1 TaxID=3064538 RepID=UPI00274168BE|nr:FAD-dependent oxidoreductase [Actinoplanes sp. RD1]